MNMTRVRYVFALCRYIVIVCIWQRPRSIHPGGAKRDASGEAARTASMHGHNAMPRCVFVCVYDRFVNVYVVRTYVCTVTAAYARNTSLRNIEHPHTQATQLTTCTTPLVDHADFLLPQTKSTRHRAHEQEHEFRLGYFFLAHDNDATNARD